MKLIVYSTPSHETLVSRLLASEIGEYKLVHVRGPQVGNGLFRQQGFRATMIEKIRLLRREATEDFVYVDADVVFLRPSMEVVESELEGHDCLFQNDSGGLCAGLFAMRANKACRDLLDRWCFELEQNASDDEWDDQRILNAMQVPATLKIGFLSRRFSNPFIVLGKGWGYEDIALGSDVVAFHANWVFELERKLKLIDMIWDTRHERKHMLIQGRPHGFFSMFLHTVDQLMVAEENGMDAWVEWGPECPPYYSGMNIWEHFFEQPMLKEKPPHFNVVSNNFGCHTDSPPGGYGQQHVTYGLNNLTKMIDQRRSISDAMHRLVRWKIPSLATGRFAEFQSTLPRDYICIHIRGTDRQIDADLAPLDKYTRMLRKYHGQPLVVCADSTEAIEAVQECFPKAKAYPAYRRKRYNDLTPIHSAANGMPYKIAEDITVEFCIMAAAKILIHSGANVATAAWYWNLDLQQELIHLTHRPRESAA